MGIVRVRFPSWPASDGMLYLIKNSNIQFICRTSLGEKVGESVFAVILIQQFQDRLPEERRKPSNRSSGCPLSPFHRANEPGALLPRQLRGSRLIGECPNVFVFLQETCREGIRHRFLDCLCENLGLRVTPCKKDYFSGIQNSANPHSNCVARDIFLTKKISSGILAC